jgi:hypothetical protein
MKLWPERQEPEMRGEKPEDMVTMTSSNLDNSGRNQNGVFESFSYKSVLFE